MTSRLAPLPLVLLALAPATPVRAQAAAPGPRVTEIRVPGSPARARLWSERRGDGSVAPYYSLSLDGERFLAPREADHELHLRYARFDPARGEASIPVELRARADSRLHVVQFWTRGISAYRAALRAAGAEIHRYLPEQAHLVEMDAETAARVRALPFVRSVAPFHPAYKLEEPLLAGLARGEAGQLTVDLLTTRRGAHGPIVRWIEAQGGTVEHVSAETHLMTATLPRELLPELAARDDVQWIDRWQAAEGDMNIARNVHGADFVETAYGLTGAGVRVEVMDAGCDTTHPDMQDFLVHNGNTADAHGTCTSGIVLGDGLNRVGARGAAPDAFLVIADYGFSYAGGSRYAHTGQLVNPALAYRCVLQSNSWGSGLTTSYSSTAQDMDLILFDHSRISICQSQSNAGTTSSRPQAWAKNVISVGGMYHRNTTSKTDDDWAGGASIGPAADGRIKPDLASFFDSILCADMVGTSGYSTNDYYTGFGGTSGATPIVAGHLALLYQMWHEGLFGNPTPGATPFDNAPQNTTAKALLINSASQWAFSGTNHDRARTHQGWGHPDLKRLAEATARMVVIDESDVLTELQSTSYELEVLPGEASLRVTLVYRDPPGTTSASIHRINDLDLMVTSPGAVVYHGNFGLDAGNYSQPGGSPNTRDTVENVFVQLPEPGIWTITVTASDVNDDSHVETPQDDVDYALVVSGAAEPALAPPTAPTDLAGRAAAQRARLSFVDTSDDELGFELERADDGVTFLPLVTLGAGVVQHDDTGLALGATYLYRVRAFNGAGASAWSDTLVLETGKADTSESP